eukprot:77317-Hanusia_phi.AAC.3
MARAVAIAALASVASASVAEPSFSSPASSALAPSSPMAFAGVAPISTGGRSAATCSAVTMSMQSTSRRSVLLAAAFTTGSVLLKADPAAAKKARSQTLVAPDGTVETIEERKAMEIQREGVKGCG